MPNSQFLIFWESLVILTLIYIGTLGIYIQTFMNQYDSTLNLYITNISDFIFGLDIILNFMTAYHREDFRLETRLKFIAINYLFGGFFIFDLIAAIPLEQIIIQEDDKDFSTFRMIKLLRLFKLIKLSKYNNRLRQMIKTSIDIRLVIAITICGLMSHISACLLYQSA